MTIRPEDAAAALLEAQGAAERSSSAFRYERASPHLILWGVVWVVGNVAAVLRLPLNGNIAWPALMLVGTTGSIWLGVREQRDGRRSDGVLRALTVTAAFMLFGFGLAAVVPMNSLANAEAIMALLIGAAYMVMGLWTGWRLSAIGAALMLTIILAAMFDRDRMFLWMAVAGGGGLVLGGLWLRKV